MKILGISCYYHDSSAALLIDGKVVSAVAEERFTRKKHDSSFPINALNFCLSENNLTIEDIDYVAFYEKPVLKFERFLKFITAGFPKTFWQFISFAPSWLKEKILILQTIRKKLKYKKQVFFIEHHVSHAASFLVSPFDEASILVVDGVGEFATTSYGYGRGNKIDIRKEINFPHSIGLLYSAITAYLGFSVNNSEYKVMGLAAYGEKDKNKNEYYEKLKKTINMKDDGSFELNMSYFDYQYGRRMCSRKMFDLLEGKPRKKDEEVKTRHKDIASALQMITEEVLVKMLNNLHKEFPFDNLVFAGGVALNSVFNGKILKNTKFKNVWISPDPGDGGTSIGCAEYLYYHILNEPRLNYLRSAYLGPEFSNQQIKKILESKKVKYKEFNSQDEIVKETAKLIFENKIVGWFQGKMEFGPRALGNRSILANPLNKDMQNILNLKVKHREEFRPFAPVVLKEDMDKYFECDKNFQIPCNFMLMVYPIKEEWKEKIPAVTHIDGTGRLQAIEESQNPIYYQLIKEFEKLSGIPVLINTSFNVMGEPIVCTPDEAFSCMMGTEIDYLVMGNYLVKRSDNFGDTKNKKSRKPMNKEIKKAAGFMMVATGLVFNPILTNGFFIKNLNVSGGRFIIFFIIELLFIILGMIIFLRPDISIIKFFTKRYIGAFFFVSGIIISLILINKFYTNNLQITQIKSFDFFISFALGIFLVVIGMVFILRPEYIAIREIFEKKKEFLLLFICLVATDFILSFIVPPTYKAMNIYGFGITNPAKHTRSIQDTPKNLRTINIQYFNNGFKRWGDLKGDKKILILGDSYTQDEYVSNGEEWYSYLEKSYSDVGFFVYGVSGFGSLQEYMALDKYVDKINPEVILWQFCGNDYSNNYYPYDKMFYGLNNLAVRPYLEGDKIVYRLPLIYSQLRQYSAIADKIFALYDKKYFNDLKKINPLPVPAIPDDIIKKAFNITETIMKKVSARVGNRKIYLFNSCGPITKMETEICKTSGITCIGGIREGVEKMATKDDPVHPVGDGHWNLKGNKIAGEELADYFQKNNVFSSPKK